MKLGTRMKKRQIKTSFTRWGVCATVCTRFNRTGLQNPKWSGNVLSSVMEQYNTNVFDKTGLIVELIIHVGNKWSISLSHRMLRRIFREPWHLRYWWADIERNAAVMSQMLFKEGPTLWSYNVVLFFFTCCLSFKPLLLSLWCLYLLKIAQLGLR